LAFQLRVTIEIEWPQGFGDPASPANLGDRGRGPIAAARPWRKNALLEAMKMKGGLTAWLGIS
jgi:hypothetical protein